MYMPSLSGPINEIGPTRVLLRNIRYRQRPSNAKGGVIIAQAARRKGLVSRRNQIIDLDIVAESLESVSEAPWNIQLVRHFALELEPLPPTVGWRSGADVNYHIVDRASQASHKLDLVVGTFLKVHASQAALANRM